MPTKTGKTNGTPQRAHKTNLKPDTKRGNPPDFHWERPAMPDCLSTVDRELITVGHEVLDILEKRKADIILFKG